MDTLVIFQKDFFNENGRSISSHHVPEYKSYSGILRHSSFFSGGGRYAIWSYNYVINTIIHYLSNSIKNHLLSILRHFRHKP